MNLSKEEVSNLRKIKESIVAVGLVDENENRKIIFGTGFFIHLKGYALTARHVVLECIKAKSKMEKNGNKFEYAIFQNYYDGSQVNLDTLRFTKTKYLILKKKLVQAQMNLTFHLLFLEKN